MIKFFNTHINIKNAQELKNEFYKALDNKQKAIFYYLNSYSFYLVEKNNQFRNAFNSADYIFPDGMSIVFALRMLKGIRLKKESPNNFLPKMLFGKKDLRIFLLGSKEDIVSKASSNIESNFDKLKVCGYHHGYFTEEKSESLIEKINSSNPNLLLVGMGMPKSELWIHQHRNLLGDFPIMTVGNFFDILSGKTKSSPEFLFNTGFEWVYRLLQEPVRLFPRYAKVNSYFIYKLSKQILSLNKYE